MRVFAIHKGSHHSEHTYVGFCSKCKCPLLSSRRREKEMLASKSKYMLDQTSKTCLSRTIYEIDGSSVTIAPRWRVSTGRLELCH